MLPELLRHAIVDVLARQHGTEVTIREFSNLSGGCINEAGKLCTDQGNFFIKYNALKKFPAMLKTESRGLTLLAGTGCIRVPEVIYEGECGDFQFLVLEYFEPTREMGTFSETLGRQLAMLHGTTASAFGLDHDNYVGALPQSNRQCSLWIDFFCQERLEKQLALAEEKRNADASLRRKFEALFRKLPSMLVEEPPSLLHGDLWSGNVMNNSGEPILIDPAVYYGNREIDLAMTTLFGGFDNTFYSAYSEHFPLQPGARDRFPLYNLYPLLVHLNLFGSSYRLQIEAVLKRYT